MDIIDFHSHILPSADHGSSSVSTSLEQLRLAKECGVSRIVATPHFYPHKEDVSRFIARRDASYKRLCESLTGDEPDIILGAEVLICDNIDEMPMIEKLCIGNSGIILLELPFTDFSYSHISTVKSLISDGYDVLLAHADRYDPKNIDTLINLGAKVQLNAASMCALFKTKHLYEWAREGKVYAIGSDLHGADKKAYKYFNKAQKKFKKYIDHISEKSDIMWNKAQMG